MTAFSAAIDTIFADPNMAADATWLPAGVPPGFPVRVIVRAPDEMQDFGQAKLQQATTVIDVRVSDLSSPGLTDQVQIGSDLFAVQGSPRRDVRRLVWSINLRPL
jgi:hypothetical protein